MLTLITLAPVCIIYDAHNAALGGTGGCYIFIEINVKRQSNPDPQSMHHSANSAQQNYFKI